MFILKFYGGLGNQIGIYCAYDWLRRNYSDIQIKADLDVYLYEKYKVHSGFELTKVFDNLDLEVATTDEILKCGGGYERHKDGLADIVKKFYINHVRGMKPIEADEWNRIRNCSITELKDRSLWLFLDWRCVDDGVFPQLLYANALKDDNAVLSGEMRTENSVSVHVRRGDYVGTHFDMVSMEYYTKAMEWIRDRISNPKFYIFSDDKEYVLNCFAQKDDCFVVDNNTKDDSYLHMQLMSCCKHNIICNSTFSTWGAILNPNPDKIIISPKGGNLIPAGFGVHVTEI